MTSRAVLVVGVVFALILFSSVAFAGIFTSGGVGGASDTTIASDQKAGTGPFGGNGRLLAVWIEGTAPFTARIVDSPLTTGATLWSGTVPNASAWSDVNTSVGTFFVVVDGPATLATGGGADASSWLYSGAGGEWRRHTKWAQEINYGYGMKAIVGIMGDVTDDGYVVTQDALRVGAIVLGDTATEFEEYVGDLNPATSPGLDGGDALKIIRKYVGLE